MVIGPLIAGDDLLLALVGASATLLGLFIVGVFFFVDSPIRRSNPQFESYLRTGTSIILLVYAIPLIAPLVLITAGPVAASILFAVLSVALFLQNIRTVYLLVRLPRGARYRALVVNEIATTLLSLTLVALPWVLGGLRPSREQLAASFILALVAAFVSTCAFVMSAFDLPSPADRGRRRISRIRLRR
jgi:hypothetical protein